MAKITVLGVGLVGSAIALDLARQHQVTAVDQSTLALEKLYDRNSGIQRVQANLLMSQHVEENIQSADVVVSAVPGFMGYRTLETIIKNGKNVVDIAFFPENAMQLDSLAKSKNITAIVDMGVAPGLSNLVLGHHASTHDIQSFKCLVGGLPLNPQPPFYYKAPFSPVDVIEEYIRPARLVRNGKRLELPALSEIESVHFDNIGPLEAFNTDGLRTLIDNFPDIPDMVEKTLRYPGHAQLFQSLRDIGFMEDHIVDDNGNSFNPLELTSHLFRKQCQLEEEEPEFTIMRINLAGQSRDSGQVTHIQYDLYDEYDTVTRTGSMARTTGYTCTAAVNLLLDNAFITKGICPPEIVGKDARCFQKIMDHYRQRGINLTRSVI